MERAHSTQIRRIGRYELCSKIASGGMASVYFGRSVGSEGFSRVVAIKRMHPHLAEDTHFRTMFIDEASLAAQIHHPNVTQIIDLVSEGDELLLVMSYVHGATGSTLLKDDGPLEAAIAIRVAIDALLGLHAAHTVKSPTGLPLESVHRDVSPQNLIVSVDGVTVVLDFGVAKAAERRQTTRAGELKGKIRYMAPEQIREGPVGPWTDVYALSAVLWEMLTGARLFMATNDAALLAQVLQGEVTRPGALGKGISPALEAIVMRGLDRHPEQRFRSALAMADALEGLGSAATAREVAAVVAQRARSALEQREQRLSRVRELRPQADGPPLDAKDADDETMTGRGRAAISSSTITSTTLHDARPIGGSSSSKGARLALGLLVGALTAGIGTALFFDRTARRADPVAAASASFAAEAVPRVVVSTGVTTPAPPPTPTAGASVVAAAPTVLAGAPLLGTATTKPPRTNAKPAIDCAKNPRVLGPDGVYQVRRECLGR